MLHAILKGTNIGGTIAPLILTSTFRLPAHVLPHKLIAIMEEVAPITMSQVFEPLTFILIFVGPYMDTVALRPPIDPLANVGIASNPAPHAVAILKPLLPLTFVVIAIRPHVGAFAVGLTFFITALVDISVAKLLVAVTVPLAINP
jgi:hypothetical protein